MAFINLLLDLVVLVLGLSVLGIGTRAPTHRAGTLLGNLKPAESRPTRSWKPVALLVVLLFLRPFLYRILSDVLGEIPSWNAIPASIPFRPDSFLRLLLFSWVSFLWTLIHFLCWVLLLSALSKACRDPANWNRFFEELIGPLVRCPLPLSLLLPGLAAGLLWLTLRWPLRMMAIAPAPASTAALLEQSILVGLGVWVSIRWLLGGLLLLRLINTYVYLGNNPFWDFVHQIGGIPLLPFRRLPLQIGKLDLSPLLAAAVVFLVAAGVERALVAAYFQIGP
ncbi:MAG: YggT family protein [Limisphaerales bacterium]